MSLIDPSSSEASLTRLADFEVLVNGAKLPEAARADVRSITVDEDVDALSTFAIDLYNWDDQMLRVSWSDSRLFAVGSEVEISLGYVDALHEVMLAEITSLEASFTGDGPPMLQVRGYDLRHRMARARRTRAFSKMKDSAIAAQVAREAGLRARVTDTKVMLPYVLQSNQTDLELLQERAGLIGYEVYIRGKELSFQPPLRTGQPGVALSLDEGVTQFTVRLNALGQVDEVTVRGWDVRQKDVVVGRAGLLQEVTLGQGSSGPRTASRAFGKAAAPTVDQPVQSKAEADQIASGTFGGRAMAYVEAEASCYGDPGLRAGTVVAIQGAGDRFSGPYYVTSARHTVTPDIGYETSLTLRRNAS